MMVRGILLIVMLTPAVVLTHNRYCGDQMILNEELRTCPPRAVCGEVFDSAMNWTDEDPCSGATTIRLNCKCTISRCPVSDVENQLFVTPNYKVFTCEPVCQIPWCSTVASTSGQDPVAILQKDNSLNGYTYYTVECRCPRHHNPSMLSGDPGSSVMLQNRWFDNTTKRFQASYTCRNTGSDTLMNDPCPV